MKRINVVVVLFLMLGWSGCRENSGTVDIVTVDISQNYPKKELVLQDFMDVEYIPLETNDEFITQGDVYRSGADTIFQGRNHHGFRHDGIQQRRDYHSR